MKIVVCVDYASNTEEYLQRCKNFIDAVCLPETIVIHIVDETLFYPTSGFEVPAGDEIKAETEKMAALVAQFLPNNQQFIEEMGVPKQRIPEILAATEYDLLIMGTHSRHGLEKRLMGGLAEHLLSLSKKPILVIP
jgi:nucleotide-binding universal stress UspA family protein